MDEVYIFHFSGGRYNTLLYCGLNNSSIPH